MTTKGIVQAGGIPVEVREAVCMLATYAVNVLLDRVERR